MMVLNIKGTEYKVKFGYNSFCDTDLMERVGDLLRMFQGANVVDDKDVVGMGKLKDLFSCVRELLFVGFQKFNAVDTLQEVGNLIDDYHDEATEEDKRGILDLFSKLSEELMAEGFLAEIIQEMEKVVEMPQKKNNKKK